MPKQDTSMNATSHGAGTTKGEHRPTPKQQPPTRKAHDASGINPDQRAPIHPKMPHMPPA